MNRCCSHTLLSSLWVLTLLVPSAGLAAEPGDQEGLPDPWASRDVGEIGMAGSALLKNNRIIVQCGGEGLGGKKDGFHFVYAPMSGQGTITARIVPPVGAPSSALGVMMRKSLDANSLHASVLLLPEGRGALVSRSEKGGETIFSKGRTLGKAHLAENNQLSTPYWVRLIRFRNRFTGYLSNDGYHWREIGAVELEMGQTFFVGLPACSGHAKVATSVGFDRVMIPTWRMGGGDKLISSRPEPRWHKEAWLKRHTAMNERVSKGDVDLLMIGDSITHWWDKAGKSVWDRYYGKRRAVNLAISGDRTEHVLWRLENGNLEGISPKLAVVMIGTNNHMSSPPEVTARDIRLIVGLLRSKLPGTKVLVLAIFPRGGSDDDGARQKNMKVNELISDIGDGEMVHYLNLNEAFLNGRRLKQDLLPDGTHPNESGYEAWAKAMESTIATLMAAEK